MARNASAQQRSSTRIGRVPGKDGPRHIFSSNAPPQPPHQGNSGFYDFAPYQHHGDMKAAARERATCALEGSAFRLYWKTASMRG